MLITGGIGTFTPRPLPHGTEYEERGLVYFVLHLDVMAGLDVLIVGGGDSAFDWAASLEPIGAVGHPGPSGPDRAFRPLRGRPTGARLVGAGPHPAMRWRGSAAATGWRRST